jgi:hypothetical protein
MTFPSAVRACVEVTTSKKNPVAGMSVEAPAGAAKTTAAPRVARNTIAVRVKARIDVYLHPGSCRTD